MKIIVKNFILFLGLILMISADTTQIHKLFVIGDSTASIYSDNYHPRTGWGQVLNAFFDTEKILVVDKALSGRSSKSFYSDPNGWVTVLNQISEGDYLFIQFGHNDQKSDERYTDPYTTYQEYLSIYIDSARARGAYPVLVTSIHRNKWSGSSINDSHGDYPPAMRALAIEKSVPLIDLHAKTEALFEALGEEYTTNQIFMNLSASEWINYPEGNEDNTHLQELGAYEVCNLLTEGISELKGLSEIKILDDARLPAGRMVALTDPALSANIVGRGVYSIGEEVMLKAVAQNGYAFENWTEADTLLSTAVNLTINLNDSVRIVQANFIKAYRVTLKHTSGSHGILQGSGYYAPESEVSITATPKTGYRFLSWEDDDEVVSSDSVHTFIMGELDITYYANFEELPLGLYEQYSPAHEIIVNPNPSSGIVRFDFQNGLPEGILLSIINMKGQVVLHDYAENFLQVDNTIHLNLSNLPNGMYTYLATTKSQLKDTGVLVINH